MIFKVIIVFICIVILAFIGREQLLKKVRQWTKEVDFLANYRNRYVDFGNEYLNHGTVNPQEYDWLTLNSLEAQDLMGSNGIIAYSAPFNRMSSNNYHVLLNTLPKFRTGLYQKQEIYLVEDAITRTVGSYDKLIEDQTEQAKKWGVCLHHGVRYFVSVPVQMLYWFGIISKEKLTKISKGKGMKFFTFIGSVTAFLAALIAITIDWQKFKDIVHLLISKFH